ESRFWITTLDNTGNTATSPDFKVTLVGANQDVPADTTPPDAPTITAGYDNVGPSQGSFGSGTTTDDTTPQLSGKAEAGSLVKIYDGSALIGSAVTNASGSWSFTTPVRSDGLHNFTATATDAAGNVSGKSGGFVVTIDTFTGISGNEDFGDMSHFVGGFREMRPEEVMKWSSGLVVADITHDGKAHGLISNMNINKSNITQHPVDIYSNALFKISFGGEAESFSANFVISHSSTLNYYNSEGQLLHTQTLASAVPTTPEHAYIYWSAPAGESISYLTVQTGSKGHVGLWDIAWGDDAVSTLHAPLQMEMPATYDDVLPLMMHMDDAHHSAGKVDITDNHHNTLQLTLNDILSEAHDNLFVQDGHKQLAVTGDAGDVVELKVEDLAHNTWQDAGQVTAGGVQYEVYHHTGSDVELLVQHGVELHQVS
ncbi:Ig-like domain-containing protein, partial [Enterobacteriaceae bacterium H11S18]|uniref:Ig-like domain-containing protein n=1 Tax=Dryocola clanedunensis TaxID=2925396 RepID=UPI0022F1144A